MLKMKMPGQRITGKDATMQAVFRRTLTRRVNAAFRETISFRVLSRFSRALQSRFRDYNSISTRAPFLPSFTGTFFVFAPLCTSTM